MFEAYQRAERTGEPCLEDRRPRDGRVQKPNHDHAETIMVKTATSRDGTGIAYDQLGGGPPVVLVGGAMNTRSFGPNGSLAELLRKRFTVINS